MPVLPVTWSGRNYLKAVSSGLPEFAHSGSVCKPRKERMKDTLQKFMVDNAPVRGELVELSATWQQVLARRDYPVAVKRLLGEMLSAAALLSATLKFNGVIVMQVHGDGPVKLLVVECDSELRLRATAKVIEGEVVPDDATLTQLVNLNGQGHFAITLDPQDKMPGQQAYQGIVPLDGDDARP